MLRFGIDLGGTKIEGAIVDPAGAVQFRERIPTEAAAGYTHVIERIATLYTSMVAAAGGGAHTLGIGTPGSISPTTGLLRNSNTVLLNGRPLAADLERRLGREFAIDNDANCFALAEARFGAGRGQRVVFGVIIGTGCGGGIVIDGQVHAGRQGIAGEWGHMSVDPAGPACYCGRRGCIETLISGSGLERRYRELNGGSLAAPAIIAAWRARERRATWVMEEYIAWFGRSLANLVDVLDPDVVVLGGGLSNVAELYTLGVESLRHAVFADHCTTRIEPHQLGDSAGVIGAALIGR